jgi:hypothetical protein
VDLVRLHVQLFCDLGGRQEARLVRFVSHSAILCVTRGEPRAVLDSVCENRLDEPGTVSSQH